MSAGAGDAPAETLAGPRFFVLRRRCRPIRERLEEGQLATVSEPLDLEDARVSSTRDLDVLAEGTERRVVDDYKVVAPHDDGVSLVVV